MVMYNKIDPKSIAVDKVVKPESGNGTFVNLCYGSQREPLTFQTPTLKLAWPVQVREYKGKHGCVLPLALGSPDEVTQHFKQWLNDVNEHLKALSVENSLDWYGKKLSLDDINDEIFTDLVKLPKDPKYEASYIPKINFDEDDFSNLKVDVYDAHRQLIPASESLTKGAQCAAIIKIRNVFLGKGIKRVSINNEVVSVFCIPAQKETGWSFDTEADPVMAAAMASAEENFSKRKAEEEAPPTEDSVEETPAPAVEHAAGEASKSAPEMPPPPKKKVKKATPGLFDGDDV
jgi:hypothetical protein